MSLTPLERPLLPSIPASLLTPCGTRVKSGPAIQLVVVDLTHGEKGHKPLTCTDHRPCAQLDSLGGTTDDLKLLRRVMAIHPATTVGVSPGATLICLDFDDRDLLRQFVRATKVRPRDGHVVVQSPRGKHGLHFWFAVSGPVADIAHRKGLDIRQNGHGRRQYAMAPDTVRGDGGAYTLISGTWGEFTEAPQAVLDWLTTPPAGAPVRKPADEVIVPDQQSLPAAVVARVLAEMDAHPLVKHRDRSEATYAALNILLGAGLAPEAHHHFALSYTPALMDKVWRKREYTKLSLTRQALKAAQTFKPSDGSTRLRYEANLTRGFLIVQCGGDPQHNLVKLFDFILTQVNLHQKDVLGIGTQELVDRFGITKPTATAWLRKLEAYNCIAMTAEFVHNPRTPAKSRVREWRVLGLTTA